MAQEEGIKAKLAGFVLKTNELKALLGKPTILVRSTQKNDAIVEIFRENNAQFTKDEIAKVIGHLNTHIVNSYGEGHFDMAVWGNRVVLSTNLLDLERKLNKELGKKGTDANSFFLHAGSGKERQDWKTISSLRRLISDLEHEGL